MVDLAFQVTPDNETKTLEIERLLNCGYTGRDEAAVQAHIDELAEEGITSPDEFPTLYPKPNHLLSQIDGIEVLGEHTSGEAEFVLFPTPETTYVGVGSDHTDREVEREDIPLAKTICPNLVGEGLWRLRDVEDHWDELVLRSWVTSDGERIAYQNATVDAIRTPEDLLLIAKENARAPIEGMAIYSGSVATSTDEFVFGERFEVELYDPVLDRSLTCAYNVEPISWLE